jgi:hypothetical protein
VILKSHWLGLAAGEGFETVYGHARPGAPPASQSSSDQCPFGGSLATKPERPAVALRVHRGLSPFFPDGAHGGQKVGNGLAGYARTAQSSLTMTLHSLPKGFFLN